MLSGVQKIQDIKSKSICTMEKLNNTSHAKTISTKNPEKYLKKK